MPQHFSCGISTERHYYKCQHLYLYQGAPHANGTLSQLGQSPVTYVSPAHSTAICIMLETVLNQPKQQFVKSPHHTISMTRPSTHTAHIFMPLPNHISIGGNMHSSGDVGGSQSFCDFVCENPCNSRMAKTTHFKFCVLRDLIKSMQKYVIGGHVTYF